MMKNKYKIICVALCAFCMLIFFALSFGVLNVKAYADISAVDEKTLYNETNTYNISNDCFDDNGFISTYESALFGEYKFRYKPKYDLSQRNENSIMAYPQITVLTPGLGSHAVTWSNNFFKKGDSFEFSYDSKSIIAKIDDFAGGANIYYAKMKLHETYVNVETDVGTISAKKPTFELELHDITNQRGKYGNNKIDGITDISKHIIIVFDPGEANGLNDNIYYQLNYALSKIIYDVKILNGGKLPKLNLIGHSRGGLTNLQYTLDHPDLVESLISIGTPYFSSTTANVFGEIVMGEKSAGLADILDPDIYYDYNKRWNNNYNRLYKDINVYAYGSYHTLRSLCEVVLNDTFDSLEGKGGGIAALLGAINTLKLVTAKNYLSEQLILGLISECLDMFFPSSKVVDFLEILFKELNFDIYPMFVSWYNDILVDLDSQLGLDSGNLTEDTGSYKGFKRIIRPFIGGRFDSVDYSRVAAKNVPVGHNLVPRDEVITTSIVCRLKLGATADFGFRTSENADGTLKIDGYKGGYVGSNFEIPATIDGKTVTEISPFAFLGLDKDNITAVTIPSSVKSIGSYAFSGFTELTAVNFGTSSTLTAIDEGAFSGCSKLLTITLPATLAYITPTAFTGCDSLGSINVATGNANYSSNNGVLLNKNGTRLIYYPTGKPDTSLTLDSGITEIGEMAFYNNKNLTSVDLNNVTFVREEAFFNCANLATINGSKVRIIERGALSGTEWFNDKVQANIGYISLGTALYSYNGSEPEIDLSAYTNVCEGAFAANHTVEKVTFGNNMSTIGSYAFYDCTNLKNIYINNCNNLVYVGTLSFGEQSENMKIYIPKVLQSEYEENELWKQYDLSVHQTNVIFELNGGSCDVTSGSIYYQDFISLPTPVRENYIFDGWYDNPQFAGSKLNQGDLWNSLADSATLYAKWLPVRYSITYYPDGGEMSSTNSYYTVEDAVEFPIPTKDGNNFDGWYYDSALTQSAGTGFAAGETGNKSLYAKWLPNTYTVLLDLNDDEKDRAVISSTSAVVTFGESYILPVPSRNGYCFNGWRAENGELYTIADGSSFRNWNITENTTLYADWTRKEYYIRVNANGTISWLGAGGFSETQVPIAYGTEFMTATEIEQAFNPQKISYREGGKFSYFTLQDGTKFVSWAEIPDLGASGTIITIYANFIDEINFGIAYYNFNVSAINPLVANYGADISLMIPDSSKGYMFKKWTVASVDKAPGNSIFMGTSLAPGRVFDYNKMPDLSIGREEDGTIIYLEACFEACTYQITVSSNLGSLPETKINVIYDERVTLPTVSSLGRNFLGWFTEDGTQITTGTGEMIEVWEIDHDITLEDRWSLIEYSITYVGASKYSHSNVTKFTIEDLPLELTDAECSGERFMGWYTDEEHTTRVYNITTIGNKMLYPYSKQLHIISFDSNGGTPCAEIVGVADEEIILPASTLGGYKGTWAEWGYITDNTDVSNFGYSYTIGNNDITLRAIWKEKTLSECLNNNVYEIWTYNQLDSVRINTFEENRAIYGTYKLMANITASGYWTPGFYPLIGTFDGNNKQITGLKIKANESSPRRGYFIGMFCDVYGTIKNLKLLNTSITVSGNTTFYVGTLAGRVTSGAKLSNCKISATSGNTSSVSITGTSEKIIVGGLAAYNKGVIEKCRFNGKIYTSTNGDCDAGGLVGYNHSGKIYTSWVNGNLDINSRGGSCYFNVGGLVGKNVYDSSTGVRPEIKNCYSTSTVFIDCTGQKSYVYAGGLVGVLNGCKVQFCYATGKVTGKNKYGTAVAGGLAADIEDCISDGYVCDVFSTGDVYARGNYSGAETSSSFFGHFCGAEKNNAFLNIYYNKNAKFKDGKTGTEVTWNASWYNGKTVAELKSRSFQINELGLSESIWRIVDGSYPTLR